MKASEPRNELVEIRLHSVALVKQTFHSNINIKIQKVS